MEFTAAQAARLSGCTPAQLRYWAQSGLVIPSRPRRYSFEDLIVLRVVHGLLNAGLPTVRMAAAVRGLRAAGERLACLRLVTDGREVWACYDDGQILDALGHGQLALFVAVDQVVSEVRRSVVAFDAERAAFLDGLVRAAAPPSARARAAGA